MRRGVTGMTERADGVYDAVPMTPGRLRDLA